MYIFLDDHLETYKFEKKYNYRFYHLPSPGANGKHKMHELYTMWLSCRGVWSECSLAIRAHKSNTSEFVELYDYITAKDMRDLLGDDLANDLIERHVANEKKLPTNMKGQFIKVFLGL